MTETHLPAIIQDLALILIAAAAITLLFKVIKQPVVLGYIIAGFLVSPSVNWLPTVRDTESIKVWAEIGVIFLLFALGLEFSFKKLVRVGPSASITATVEIVGMLIVGYTIGQLFSWNTMDSLFLGGILAISSTTIIIRAFDELGMKARGFASLVFGVLIVEDLIAILLMVILSTVAVTQTFSGIEMGRAALKLGFFLTLWFVLGIFLLPSALSRARKYLNSETLLVISVGICFAMVVVAAKVGFSPALGAFIMGSILAETKEGERIEHLIHPVKDLFAAIFFVSVGMLINLDVLRDYAFPIFVITLATVFGKFFTTTLGALLSGRSLRHSVQAGMSLAQIGEFSFIIASLGLTLNVTSEFLFPIAISVSALTTFTTPYLIRSADQVVNLIEKALPIVWRNRLERFHASSSNVGHSSDLKNLLNAYLPRIFVNLVIVIAVFLIVENVVMKALAQVIDDSNTVSIVSLIVALLLSSPFVWAMGFSKVKSNVLTQMWLDKRYQATLFVLEAARWTTPFLVIGVLSSRFLPARAVVVSIAILMFSSMYLISRYVGRVYLWIESRFVSNLNLKESENEARLPALAPWDSHMAQIQMSPESPLTGYTLAQAKIREAYGISVAMIERGQKQIPAPGRDAMLFPGDILHVIGTDEQIQGFKKQCEFQESTEKKTKMDYMLSSIHVEKSSPFVNQTIRECGIRDKTRGLVVGIEKTGRRVLNPDSTLKIEEGDILWIVGDRRLISGL